MAACLKIIITSVVLIGFYACFAQGRIRRCYTCRSRGDLGDCKDPFVYNATNVEEVKGVEAIPCASGWCAKIIEGEKNSDFDTATERMCVQRPPGDGEERCSDTVIDRKPVYMCFCHGDLCNASEKIKYFHPMTLMIASIIVVLFSQWLAA